MSLRRRLSMSLPKLFGFTSRSFKSLEFPRQPLRSSNSSGESSLIHGIHVFHCPDAVGIVAKLSDCMASRGGNILGADVFVPESRKVFYSRSEFLFDPVKWPRAQMDENFLKLSNMFNAKKSVVRDHCLVDLLHGWQDGKLPVDITCVRSNHDRGPNTNVFRFLGRHGIPYHNLCTTKENKREEEILDLIQESGHRFSNTC